MPRKRAKAPVPLSMGAFGRRRVLVLVASMRIAGGGESPDEEGVDLRRALGAE